VDEGDGDVDIDVDVVGDEEACDWAGVPSLTHQGQGPTPIVVDEEQEAINEFRLDLHLSSPSPVTTERTESEAGGGSSSEGEQETGSGSEDEDMKASSDTKENTCDLPPLLAPTPNQSLLPSAMTDHSLLHNKCSSLSPTPNHNNNVMMVNSNPSSLPSPGSEGSGGGDKSYSSCGHSSIFGELQSVVFHSLIASLET
jgi:hypothetical protein